MRSRRRSGAAGAVEDEWTIGQLGKETMNEKLRE